MKSCWSLFLEIIQVGYSTHTEHIRCIFGLMCNALWTDFDNADYDGKWNIQLFDSNQNKWICVTIDDCLPTINNNLLFGSCKDKSQFWFALLEKACAK